MMEWKSVGMMRFPIYGKIKFMFQSTNQINYTIFIHIPRTCEASTAARN
jgi:hypothetical protein